MKVKLMRSQKKGFLSGKVKFTLTAKAMLSDEERFLIKKYDMGSEILTVKEINIPFFGKQNISIKIHNLVEGVSFDSGGIDMLLAQEETIIVSCRNLQEKLHVLEAFEGEIIIDFDEDNQRQDLGDNDDIN